MADMHVIECDTAKAEAMFERALDASRRSRDQATEAAALAGLAHVAARTHKFKEATLYAEQAESRALRMESSEATTLAARVKNVMGAVSAFEGRYTQANDLMEEALRLAHEAGDARMVRAISHNLALPAFMEGDFRAALRYFSRTPISDARGDAGRQLHPDLVMLYVNRAAICTALGELVLAEQDLDKAAEVTALFNLRNYMPGIYEGRANIARERRQFDRADQLYASALDEYHSIEADPVAADLHYERALLEMRRGALDRALELIDVVVANRRESRREIEEAVARQLRGRILAARAPALALKEAEASEPLLRSLQCNYYLAIGCHLRARVLAGVDDEAGRRALVEFLSLAERFDYGYFLACEESYQPAINDLCRLYSVSSEWVDKIISNPKFEMIL
jgi:tetratricopeptide (TPR) repeat protein